MKNIKYIIWKEGDFYVSQCLNVDVSSFGKTYEEAVKNLKEALELYFEDNDLRDYTDVESVTIGECSINV